VLQVFLLLGRWSKRRTFTLKDFYCLLSNHTCISTGPGEFDKLPRQYCTAFYYDGYELLEYPAPSQKMKDRSPSLPLP
jgi:hypothetical protein